MHRKEPWIITLLSLKCMLQIEA